MGRQLPFLIQRMELEDHNPYQVFYRSKQLLYKQGHQDLPIVGSNFVVRIDSFGSIDSKANSNSADKATFTIHFQTTGTDLVHTDQEVVEFVSTTTTVVLVCFMSRKMIHFTRKVFHYHIDCFLNNYFQIVGSVEDAFGSIVVKVINFIVDYFQINQAVAQSQVAKISFISSNSCSCSKVIN